MTTAMWVTLYVWLVCLGSEWYDDFAGVRRLVREMRRQWGWLSRLARRLTAR